MNDLASRLLGLRPLMVLSTPDRQRGKSNRTSSLRVVPAIKIVILVAIIVVVVGYVVVVVAERIWQRDLPGHSVLIGVTYVFVL